MTAGRPTEKHSGDFLHVLRIGVPAEKAEFARLALACLDIDASSWEEAASDRVIFEMYFTEQQAARKTRTELDRVFRSELSEEAYASDLSAMQNRDWQESWKQFFHAQRVSERLVVRPPWEQFPAREGDCVIDMDPGMSFGTGLHFTTRSCLVFLDRLAADRKCGAFLDLGCGSGILSIAAVKLGYGPVVAVDNDPEAISSTRRNAADNKVAADIEAQQANLEELENTGRYDVVAANILSSVLIRCAPRIAECVSMRPGCPLLLAGITPGEYGNVRRTYEEIGFREVETLSDDSWVSGRFERSGRVPPQRSC